MLNGFVFRFLEHFCMKNHMWSFYSHAIHLNNSYREWLNLKEDLIGRRLKEAFSQPVASFIDLVNRTVFFPEFQLMVKERLSVKVRLIINNIKNVLVIRNPLKSRANVANRTHTNCISFFKKNTNHYHLFMSQNH